MDKPITMEQLAALESYYGSKQLKEEIDRLRRRDGLIVKTTITCINELFNALPAIPAKNV